MTQVETFFASGDAPSIHPMVVSVVATNRPLIYILIKYYLQISAFHSKTTHVYHARCFTILLIPNRLITRTEIQYRAIVTHYIQSY